MATGPGLVGLRSEAVGQGLSEDPDPEDQGSSDRGRGGHAAAIWDVQTSAKGYPGRAAAEGIRPLRCQSPWLYHAHVRSIDAQYYSVVNLGGIHLAFSKVPKGLRQCRALCL